MPKKKPRSVSFTMHMDGQDSRAISVKLCDSPDKGILTLTCRLAGAHVVLQECPLALHLFSLASRVKKMDAKRDKEFHEEEESTMKMLAVGGTTISATQQNDA
jgi:hypothetical protein